MRHNPPCAEFDTIAVSAASRSNGVELGDNRAVVACPDVVHTLSAELREQSAARAADLPAFCAAIVEQFAKVHQRTV